MATMRMPVEHRRSDDGSEERGVISDSELERAALSADADAPISDDAEPLTFDDSGPGLLPEWYMPVPRGLRRRPAQRLAVVGIIVSLIVVNAAGLCVTSGWPEIAW
jgi:hypothetical protein